MDSVIERSSETSTEKFEKLERLRILEALHVELQHDFYSPLSVVESTLSVLERFAADLIAFISEGKSSGESLLANHSDPEVSAYFRRMTEMGEKMNLEYMMGKISLLIRGAQERADRVRNSAAALMAFSGGNSANGTADVDQMVKHALFFVRGRLKYHHEIDSHLNSPPKVIFPATDLMHVVVVLLLQAAASVSKGNKLTVSTDSIGDEVLISVVAENIESADRSTAWVPSVEESTNLVRLGGGSLVVETGPDGFCGRVQLPAAGVLS